MKKLLLTEAVNDQRHVEIIMSTIQNSHRFKLLKESYFQLNFRKNLYKCHLRICEHPSL